MTSRFINGQTIDETDYIQASTGVSDAGKAVVTSDTDGQIDKSFIIKHLKFGGTGADGALTISSGTTNIDLAGAQVVIKNYSSISITGTGALTFSNPHANGTVIIFKNTGNTTITSSATPNIDIRNLGGAGGNAGSGAGRGGKGAGALYIETAGALDYTGTIYAQGENAVAHSGTGAALGSNAGGGGGTVIILANSITANTGTTTVTAGSGSANQGGGTGTNIGSNGTLSKGLYGIFKGGTGGGNSNSTISTEFGIVPTINTLATKNIILMPASGGGGGGYASGSLQDGGAGVGLGGTNGVAIVGLNNEFV